MKLNVNKNYEIKLNGHNFLFNLKHFYGNDKKAMSLFGDVISRTGVKPEENTLSGEKIYSDPLFIIVNAFIHENKYLERLLLSGDDSSDIRNKYIENIKEISNLDRFKRKYEILTLDRGDIYGFQIRINQNVTSDIGEVTIPLINVDRKRSIPNMSIFTLGMYEISDTILNKLFRHYRHNHLLRSMEICPANYSLFDRYGISINDLDLAIMCTLNTDYYFIDCDDSPYVGHVYFFNKPREEGGEIHSYLSGRKLINLLPNILTSDMLKRELEFMNTKSEYDNSQRLGIGDIDKFVNDRDVIKISIYGEAYTYSKTRPIMTDNGRRVYELLTSRGEHRYYLPSVSEMYLFKKFEDGEKSDMEKELLHLNSTNIIDRIDG